MIGEKGFFLPFALVFFSCSYEATNIKYWSHTETQLKLYRIQSMDEKKSPPKKLSQLRSIHLWWFFGSDHVPRRTNVDCGLNVDCMNTNKTGKKCWRKTHKSQKEVFFQLLCYIGNHKMVYGVKTFLPFGFIRPVGRSGFRKNK